MRRFKKILKIAFFNLVIFSAGIFFVEYFFGNWRGHKGMERLNVPHDIAIEKDISSIYPSATGKIFYKRDRNGLRGPFSDVSKVRLLTVGGSTTDQSDITEGETWQDILASRFKEAGKDVQIANAGIDGQSVLGHSRSLHIWLKKIPNLRPKYVLAYIGINDTCSSEKMYAPFFEDENSIESLIATKSALYYLYRTFRGILLQIKKEYRLGKFVYPETPNPDHNLTDKPIIKDYQGSFGSALDAYEKRLYRLLMRIREFHAEPILITQQTYHFKNKEGQILGAKNSFECWGRQINGVDDYYVLDLLNQRTLSICRKENLICFDLAKELELKYEDFSDLEHNTPSGCAKIGEYLYSKMKDLV